MEVVVTEEKKKIFRAKKTMKISDRQQLESLHNTLLTAAPGLSDPSPPPLMNGTHKEDEQKLGDKEQNSISDSNSPNAPSPTSPAPFLSLNLSPSPASSQSPKEKEETPTSPTSPFHSLNFELKKMEEDEEKKDFSTSSLKESIPPTLVVSEKNKDKGTEVVSEKDQKEEGQPATKDQAVDSAKESVKDSYSCADVTQEKEIKDEDMKEAKDDKNEKKGSIDKEKMEVDFVKVETKKEKTDSRQTTKLPRPSSTPPSNTVQEEKGSTSGLKRTLSEGFEKDAQTVKREGKRPKMEREELEELELKITAKSGGHHKLGKIVQQLVDERLRILELTMFDKHFQELKDRVDKIDCATKHQTAINTLQAKIARLSKKFGEANQMSENKRKQEALAAAAAAKAASIANNPQGQRVLRRQTVEQQPEVPRVRVAPSVGKTPALPVKKEKKDEQTEEQKDMSRHVTMAKKLAEYSEGKCRADIKLRTITSHLEKVLFQNCKRSSGNPRPDRYASYIFRYLVPYDEYCDWVAKVNYVGLLGKEALPINLRRTLKIYIERRFPSLSCDNWREIRDVINEILRVKRRPEFFREYDERTAVSF